MKKREMEGVHRDHLSEWIVFTPFLNVVMDYCIIQYTYSNLFAEIPFLVYIQWTVY